MSLFKKVLLSPDEPRLRAGWRLLAQLLLLLFVSLPAAILLVFWPAGIGFELIIGNGMPIVVSVFISRRIFDRRSFRSLGLHLNRQAGRDVLIGIGIAVLQTSLVFFLELAFGWLKVEGFAWQQQSSLTVLQGILLWLVIFIAVGFYEELLSRGYQLQNLEEGLNTFWAVLLSSMVFGTLHFLNPNANWFSAVGITLSGMFLAYAYLATRKLWLPIGLHIGWNLFLGPVFGFPVSGLESSGLIKAVVDGPLLFTGGEFGPEAGLLLLPALGAGALLVWLVTRGRLGHE
ncbi:MAG: type II CAAX endopeptidase family protein [Anaerolineales bacterium]